VTPVAPRAVRGYGDGVDTLTPVDRSTGEPAAPIEPSPRRRWLRIGVVTVLTTLALVLLVGAVWATNYEPLGADSSAVGVRPGDAIVDRVDATAPGGSSFTEYRLRLDDSEVFRYLFWLHNDGPIPVTLTEVGRAEGDHFALEVERVRVGPALGSDHPSSELPYVVPAHGYVAVEISERFTGCLEPSTQLGFGVVPVAYETLGLFRHDVWIVMPMSITILGASGCSG
jgi:hypothetical protein